jgi:outer membrane protein assembly factor BamD (BamD/ComL family)
LLAAHTGLKAALGDEHKRTQKAVQNMIELYEAWGKAEEATRYRALIQTNQPQ